MFTGRPEDDTIQFWGLASKQIRLPFGTLALRALAPSIGVANYVYYLRPGCRTELDIALDAAAQWVGTDCRVVIESRTPPWVEAELLLRGWSLECELRLVLPHSAALTGVPRALHIRPASELDPLWTARSVMFRCDHLEEDSRHGADPRPEAHTLAIIEHRKEMEHYASYFCVGYRGTVTGFICVWKSPAEIGVIEDVFVHSDHRGEGIGSALLHHAVGVLRTSGAGDVSIAAEVGDTPGQLYARLGFIPERVARSYRQSCS